MGSSAVSPKGTAPHKNSYIHIAILLDYYRSTKNQLGMNNLHRGLLREPYNEEYLLL
jgi:hypothetical protein